MTCNDDDPYAGIQTERDVWVCQACGNRFKKAWPKDREKYYSKPWAATCPRCKSKDAVPQGY